jgi:hypothetical protein
MFCVFIVAIINLRIHAVCVCVCERERERTSWLHFHETQC